MRQRRQPGPERAVGRLGRRVVAGAEGVAGLGGAVAAAAVAGAAATKDQLGGTDVGGRRRVGSALGAWRGSVDESFPGPR